MGDDDRDHALRHGHGRGFPKTHAVGPVGRPADHLAGAAGGAGWLRAADHDPWLRAAAAALHRDPVWARLHGRAADRLRDPAGHAHQRGGGAGHALQSLPGPQDGLCRRAGGSPVVDVPAGALSEHRPHQLRARPGHHRLRSAVLFPLPETAVECPRAIIGNFRRSGAGAHRTRGRPRSYDPGGAISLPGPHRHLGDHALPAHHPHQEPRRKPALLHQRPPAVQ